MRHHLWLQSDVQSFLTVTVLVMYKHVNHFLLLHKASSPYSPLEFKVRMRLQISSITEELAYHKMNLTTEDGRHCPALSSLVDFFQRVLTKVRGRIYPDLTNLDQHTQHTAQKQD